MLDYTLLGCSIRCAHQRNTDDSHDERGQDRTTRTKKDTLYRRSSSLPTDWNTKEKKKSWTTNHPKLSLLVLHFTLLECLKLPNIRIFHPGKATLMNSSIPSFYNTLIYMHWYRQLCIVNETFFVWCRILHSFSRFYLYTTDLSQFYICSCITKKPFFVT